MNDPFFYFFLIAAVIGGGLLLWTYTKPGKRWLANL